MVRIMDVESEYTDVHRTFLQACANHGSLSIPQALNILMHIKQKLENNEDAPAPNENHLRELVDEINAKLTVLEQKLEFVAMDFEDHDEFLVFKSDSHSSAIRIPSDITEDEGKYFKLIMENIVTSEIKCMPAMQTLNLTTGLKITKLHAEELIDQWSNQGYFVCFDDVVHPGPRLISEFGDVLRIKYQDYIQKCQLCQQIIFQGKTCPHACDCMIHKRCATKYFKKAKRCPKCRQEWNGSE